MAPELVISLQYSLRWGKDVIFFVKRRSWNICYLLLTIRLLFFLKFKLQISHIWMKESKSLFIHINTLLHKFSVWMRFWLAVYETILEDHFWIMTKHSSRGQDFSSSSITSLHSLSLNALIQKRERSKLANSRSAGSATYHLTAP